MAADLAVGHEDLEQGDAGDRLAVRVPVVFDGHYGKPGHRRQRFRCYPNGDRSAFHRFTEPLPREAAPSGECEVCERHLEPHEGPQTPREYLFTAREIAATLMELGRGETYQSASWRVRKRFNRWPTSEDGQRRMTSHGQLAADWVEAFAPIVFEPHEISLWPDDWVVLDNLPFRRRAAPRSGSGSRTTSR